MGIPNSEGHVCPDCHEFKAWSEYHRRKASPTGHQSLCKRCQIARVMTNYNPERARANSQRYYWTHREQRLAKLRQHYYEHRNESLEYRREWYRINRERHRS
jgi:hypothetical protein